KMTKQDLTSFLKEKTLPVVMVGVEGPCQEHLQTEITLKPTLAINLSEEHSYLVFDTHARETDKLFLGNKCKNLPEEYHSARVFMKDTFHSKPFFIGTYNLRHSYELFDEFNAQSRELEFYEKPDLTKFETQEDSGNLKC
ncbi:MAG: hypothetical protein ACOCUU_03625, partial [Nanoarchaeota archaeon]